ncbi:MAG TPA: DUF3368 domain-containing protein [Gammaproteobacteria bacterium]|nr:DUF3368 domain-containing protein [Gammaproteobacteria bacterium]
MGRKIIVADTSPLIAFGRIDRLALLTEILGTIIVPRFVVEECIVDIRRPGASVIQKAIKEKIIKIMEVDTKLLEFQELSVILDRGETAAIILAKQLDAGLLIDEKLGRNVAKNLNLKIIGTAGVLLLAKKNKLIPKVYPLIFSLKESGYYLSSALIKEVMKQAQEKIPAKLELSK